MMLIVSAIIVLVLLTIVGRGLPGLIIGLWLVAAMGWVANLVAVFKGPALALWAGMEIARLIGVFIAPIGVVLGYI